MADEKVTAGKLAFDDNFSRKQHSPNDGSPGVGEIVESLDGPQSGEKLEDMLRGWLTINATAGGLAEGRLAESFRVMPTV